MARHDMALITHVGEEQAVESPDFQALGNPLRFRLPLKLGVKVIMAHLASLGEDEDLDDPAKPRVPSFDLLIRMMDDPAYEGLLFADISATTQFNRAGRPLATSLERKDLHHRLVNGSDYPLPAINMTVHTGKLVELGFITRAERSALNEIYDYNPLLFDFVLKRTLRHPRSGGKFPPSVFMAPEGLRGSWTDR